MPRSEIRAIPVAVIRWLRSLCPLVALCLGMVVLPVSAGCTATGTTPPSMSTSQSVERATPAPPSPTRVSTPASALVHSHMPPSSPEAGGTSYPIQMEDQINAMVSSAERMQALMQSPRLTDPAWQDSVTTEINVWRSTYQDAHKLEPPARYQAVHQQYLAALALANDAASNYASGLKHLDLSTMRDGAAKIQRAQQLMIDALAVMPCLS